MAKIIIQQNEASWISSLGQKIGQLLSCEPKPGFILIPGTGNNKLASADISAHLWKQLQNANSVEEKHKIFL